MQAVADTASQTPPVYLPDGQLLHCLQKLLLLEQRLYLPAKHVQLRPQVEAAEAPDVPNRIVLPFGQLMQRV